MSDWPKLDYAADKGTIETLHLLLQLIGKLPLRLHPWVNHAWHVTLRMTPSGAVTRSLPARERHFSAGLDFLEQRRTGIVVEPARGDRLLRLREPGEDIGAERRRHAVVVELDEREAFSRRHQRSLARRSPVNCQRWWG